MAEALVIIALPSLVRRVGGDVVTLIKTDAHIYHCELKRVRRSRHWQLIGRLSDLVSLAKRLKQKHREAAFIVDKISALNDTICSHPTPLEDHLKLLLNNNPSMTLGELIAKTGCSLQQARRIRFDCEMME
ncbi:ribosome recycling factor family protein [Vibrio ostreicida]|uniref:Ribosome recycling factor family protein n=1 Tax=Vibrio ostreicida TaxID=526588 RepID=A0ABT8BT28_9VIBR|nr:ribosome recycling factor family protein [Vibrio ostreicida]MDN3609823.1 ribosome recycling factor family protein [Vibrio ostreicida]MDN3612787.1 ribosome recycling factor family protein [Vibrio ostreicida]NPD09356.1 ribosome recycling factor [Vibrio ostreicida]